MSKTIDEKVVEMRFDNKQFESNVATSMSTLEKLKKSLKLDGVSKGLEKINSAAKNNNLEALGESANTVGLRFNAMYTMADQALRNITTRVQHTAESMVKALTIDPIMSGFKEYETQINAVQTIMANTSSKGTTLDQVNAALDELNKYADLTIYNFTEMTRNIGTFTAAGIDLDTSVSAIQGIANLAAVSGSTSQQASTAMYQLSQALASGTVKLMDWNSVVNAGMGGQVFQDALKETARVHGVAIDEMIEKQGSFRETLSEGWITSEILTETLKKFTMAAEEGSEQWQEYKKSLMDTGYTEAQAESILKMANTATDAATKVKTFTQLWDTLKEAAQSGWTQTWEYIIGDFEEAKAFLTELHGFFSGIIETSANRRNNLIGEVFSSNWEKLISKINEAGVETSKFEESIRNVVGDNKLDSLIEKYGSIQKAAEEGAISSDVLKKALDGIGSTEAGSKISSFVDGLEEIQRTLQRGHVGEDVKKLQTALKELGYDLGKPGIDGIIGPITESAIKAFQEANGLIANGIVGKETLDALEKAGTKVEEIDGGVKDLRESCDSLADVITETDGRELLLESLMNIIKAIHRPLSAVNEALRDTFSISPDQLYKALEALNKLTSKFVMKGALDSTTWSDLLKSVKALGIEIPDFERKLTEALKSNNINIDSLIEKYGSLGAAFNNGAISMDVIKDVLLSFDGISESMLLGGESADKLRRAFEGLFAILDIIGSVVGGGFKASFEILGEIFGSVNTDILGVTGNVGDVIVAFRDWLKENEIITKGFDKLVRGAKTVINTIKKWIAAFKGIPSVRKAIDGITAAFEKFTGSAEDMDGTMSKVKEWFATFEKSSVVQTLLAGLSKAFNWFVSTIEDAIVSLGEWLEVFKQTEGVQLLIEAVNNLVKALGKLFSGEIDANEFTRMLGDSLANILISLPKMAIQIGKDFIAGFANGLGDGVSGLITNALEFCSNFISAFASALGIHSPSTISYQHAVDWWQGFINGCKDMLGPIIEAMQPIIDFIKNIFTSFWDYITDDNGDIEWGKIISGGITIESLIILKQFAEAMDKFASAATSVAGVVNAAKIVVSNFAGAIKKLGTALSLDFTADAIMKMAIAIGILAASVWLLCQIGVENIGDLVAAVAVIGVLALILYGLANAMDKMNAVSLSIGKDGASLDGLKSGLIQIGLAMLMLAAVVKIIGGMDPEEATRGLAGLLKLAGGMVVFLALISVISLYAKDVTPFGNMMIKMAIALGLMVIVIKMISKMSPEDISLGIIVMGMFSALCIAMAIANRWAGALDGGSTFLKMAAAMGIMVIVLKMLRSMDMADVITGIAVLQAFVILLAEMALVNRLAGNNVSEFGGTIMSMSFSMLLLASVLLILSKMDEDAVKHGIKVMQYFVLLIGELILVSKLAGKESARITGNLIGMSIAIGILAGVCVLLGYIDEEDLQKGLRIVSVLGLIMAAMIWASRGTAVVNKNFTAMAIAIGVMAASVVALSFIDDSKLVGAVAAIGTLMLIFGLITKLSAGATASIGSLIAMTIVVVLLGAVLWGLSLLNVKSTLEVAASLSMLMLALGGSLALMAAVGPLATAAFPGIGVMLLVLIAVGTIIGVLCQVPNIDSAISVSVSLSVLILALSAACFIMAAAASKMAMAMAGAKQILIVLGVIVAIMAVLATFSAINPEGTIAVMKTMGQAIGEFVGGIITGVGNAALSLLPALGQALSDFMTNAQAFIDIAGSISPNIISGAGYLTAAILLLTAADFVSGLASILTLGNGSLGTVGTQLKTFGEGVKECFDVIKDIDSTAVDSASNVASMILALSECKTKQLESLDFSGIGEKLNTFGASVVQFSDTIKGKIDEGAVEAATKAGELLVTLNDSLPRSGGFLQDIIGEKDFARFSDACSDFADCIIAINEELSKEDFVIQTDKIKQIVDAGTWFSDLNAALPRAGGIAQDLAGEQDLSAFGSACSAFAAQVLLINNLVNGKDFVIQTDKIKQLVDAGTWFSDLKSALPRAGGIAQDLAGEQDLSVFGAACSAFATCIIEVNSAVNQEGFSVNLDAIEDLKNAGLKLNDLQEVLPKSGGWIQAIAGEQDISDFGKKIEAFGTAMSNFSTSINNLDDGRIDLALRTANRIKTLSESCAELDISGVYTFSTGACEIGYAIERFSKIVDDIDESAITTSASTAHSIKRLIASLSDLDVSGIDKFKPEAIGTAMKSYSDKVTGVDASSVSSSITSANRLKNFISSLSGLDTSGVGIYKSAVEELATVNVGAVVEAFSGASESMTTIGMNLITALSNGMILGSATIKSTTALVVSAMSNSIKSKSSSLTTVGKTFARNLASGISNNKSVVSNAAGSSASAGVSAIRGYYSSFFQAGDYLVSGFAQGIKLKIWIAEQATRDMAQKAKQAALNALLINSPSKVFRNIGMGVPEGFALGIGMLDGEVTGAVKGMASSAINTTRTAMSKVLDAINTDMDAQPTIRPVVDLSNVQTGVNAINGLFNTAQSVGVQANLNAIGYSMNAMRQNGKNDDVISAINKLNDKLDGVGNTYNTINGVTYDDGSNVTDAIETLVRYAKIGGRV